MGGTGIGTLPRPVVLLGFSSITISKEFFYIGQKLTEESKVKLKRCSVVLSER